MNLNQTPEAIRAELTARLQHDIDAATAALPRASHHRYVLYSGEVTGPAWVNVEMAKAGGLCVVSPSKATVFETAFVAERNARHIVDGAGNPVKITTERAMYQLTINNAKHLIDVLAKAA